MKARREPRKSSFRLVNLESGRPTVLEALSRLDQELAAARREGSVMLKLIHGYGSSGAGGDIRIAVQRRLTEISDGGQIRCCIFGEDWSRSDDKSWKLLRTHPDLKDDRDLGRRNPGITIVVL